MSNTLRFSLETEIQTIFGHERAINRIVGAMYFFYIFLRDFISKKKIKKKYLSYYVRGKLKLSKVELQF